MSRICAKKECSNIFPREYITEDGKKHNLQKRKYCFQCSPFGEHNTKNFNNNNSGICCICGEQSQSAKKKCYKCYFNENKHKKIEQVYSLVGYDCWLCGYDKGKGGVPILEFHHIDPIKKLFGLSTREFVGHKWEKVFNEIKKCVSLCCLCHREFHAGLILPEKIIDIYIKRWRKIKDRLGKKFESFGKKKLLKKLCPICKKKFIVKYKKQICCSDMCYKISIRKVKNRPSIEELLKDTKKLEFCGTGRKFGVSDNAIRKWLK